MIESTELKVLPDNITPSNYTKMRGSQLKAGYSRLIKPSSPSHMSPNIHNSLELQHNKLTPFGQHHYSSVSGPSSRKEPNNSGTKLISVMANRQGPGSRLRQRTGTPIAARNYIRTQHATQIISSQFTNLQIESSVRYRSGNDEDESQFRMSISSFHDAYKSPGSSKKNSKTEQQLLNLKLEGTQCRTAPGVSKTKQKSLKKVSEGLMHDWYITQQGSKVILSQPTQQHRKSNENFKKIIQKIQQEDDKKDDQQNYLTGGKLQGNKKIRLKTAGAKVRAASLGKNAGRTTRIKERQSAHVNVINFQEGPRSSSAPRQDQPFHKLYTRLMKQQVQTQHLPLTPGDTIDEWQKGVDKTAEIGAQMHMFKKDMQKVRRLPHKVLEKVKEQTAKEPQKQVKYIQSSQQTKLEQRKSLMKSYTFKKQGSSKAVKMEKRQSNCQDFHVEGWNHSTQFEKKDIIMIM